MKLLNVLKGTLTATVLSTALFAGGHGTHWGYTGHEGPANWGTLDSKYTMCKDGSSQSPINITKEVMVESSNMQDIGFSYKTDAVSVVNNGHTVQVNINDGSSINIDGIKFDLKQFHFHSPSENQIDGKNFPLEAHFVHASKDGELAVVAVLFEEGAENATLKKIWNKMPHEAGEKNACGLTSSMVNEFLPKSKDYYRFSGSLTTPPCSEGVRWFVLKSYATVSKEQIEQFTHVMHHDNNRPVQSINARKVMK